MAEAAFVIGLIASIRGIIDGAKQVFDAVKDTQGQPEAFRQVHARLQLVKAILLEAQTKAATFNDPGALEPLLKSCKAKAERLQELFLKVIRKDDPKWYDRYKSALRTLGKGEKVESLMEGILKDIQVLACEKLMGTATEAQVKELEEAIRDINEMPPSITDEASDQSHSGSGDNIGIFGGSGHHQTIMKAARDFVQHHYAAGSHIGSKE
jgi:hypothetical protein